VCISVLIRGMIRALFAVFAKIRAEIRLLCDLKRVQAQSSADPRVDLFTRTLNFANTLPEIRAMVTNSVKNNA
jgi:hypothetical protein